MLVGLTEGSATTGKKIEKRGWRNKPSSKNDSETIVSGTFSRRSLQYELHCYYLVCCVSWNHRKREYDRPKVGSECHCRCVCWFGVLGIRFRNLERSSGGPFQIPKSKS